MRILFIGDLMGRAGRHAALEALPGLIPDIGSDFTIVNGENAAGGFGITPEICDAVLAAGADVVTSGNHIWDQRQVIGYISSQPRLLRPENYPVGSPGKGFGVFTARSGARVLVANVQARLFMEDLDCPFQAMERLLQHYPLGQRVHAAVVDFHGEASSEKMAMGHFVDGQVSATVGTHTHVPTADAQVLPGGSAYLTDVGMCGDFDSVIGMKKEPPVQRFRHKLPTERMSPAQGEPTLCGAVIDTDPATGLATAIQPLRRGGRLAPSEPS